MALIKCPECGKDISDQSENCIHCGYPLNKKEWLPKTIDKQHLNTLINNNKEIDCYHYIQKATGCGVDESTTILKKYMLENGLKFVYKSQPPRTSLGVSCPRCGSSAISTTARGANGFWGFIGASKTVNRCSKCGHTWAPRG